MEIQFELEALSHAKNYQSWIFDAVKDELGKRVLELGAGIGNMSQWIAETGKKNLELFVVSELEPRYIEQLKKHPALNAGNIVINQYDLSQPAQEQLKDYQLDTIISFNVLEHVENDQEAVREQVALLKQSGASGTKKIIIFVPAMKIAYGEFDRKFGHFRRYGSKDLKKIFSAIDPSIQVRIHYFNLLSVIPWIIQGRFLKRSRIQLQDIQRLETIIPFWRSFDYFFTRILRAPFGQSLVCIAEIKSEN